MATISAQPAAADGPAGVDASTIRVFAVGTVGVEQLEAPGNQVVRVADASSGHGTGFVLDAGVVITAQHVVEGARHVIVRLPGDGGFFPARVVYADKAKDVAVLTVDGQLPDALALVAEPPRVRSSVFAVGYPIDATRKQPQSARGIIAGYLDDGTVQLDMALNPGNSGGPIVNDRDQVVGMAVARGNVEQGVQGIGFAVPGQMLDAALVEARRRLATGEAKPAAGMSRDSALVVDELVQHGAFYELRKKTDLAAAPAAELDKAFADVLARIQDADLLVFVASAMWNASIALEYVEPAKFELTAAQALTLQTRLRESSRAAVRRAVQLDSTVGTRSAFVALATGGSDVGAPGMTAARSSSVVLPARMATLVQAAPMLRYNEVTGTTSGLGVGGSVTGAIGRPDQEVMPLFGVAFGTVRIEDEAGAYRHTLLAAQLGLLARFDKTYVTATLDACLYSVSVAPATLGEPTTSVSDLAIGARASVGYRVGSLEVGTAARVLSGPTLWLELVYAGLAF